MPNSFDLLEQWICNMDIHSRNDEGSIEYDNKLSQFIENVIVNKEFEVQEGEDYIGYDLRINKSFNDYVNPYNQSQSEVYCPAPLRKDVDYHCRYVSDALDVITMQCWLPGKNIFIAAGTGRGKNTFVQKQLLAHFGHNPNENIIIFENREALMKQQTLMLINSFDDEVFKYNSIESYQSENMLIFGRSKNVMIISYQKAALKLLTGDRRFIDFLSKVRYAVFDEAHYLIDDSPFNKGVNIVADALLFYPAQQFYSQTNFPVMPYMPNATKIFMSGTMEELFVYLQKFSAYYQINEQYGYIPRAVEHHGDFSLVLSNQNYMNTPNSVLVIPTDYSYINPFAYRDYSDLIPQIAKNNDKWLVFVNTIAQGEELKTKLNSLYGENTAIFIHAQNKNTEASKFYEELVTKESVSVKVLIATTVIYNGVNVKDTELKNIVLPVANIPVIKQLIGRKRMSDDETELNVYFPHSSQEEIKNRFRRCIEEMISSMKERTMGVFSQAVALNQLIPDMPSFTYVMPAQQNHLDIRFSTLAWSKVHFDAMFYLYVLRHYQQNPDAAYVSVLLESLNISDKLGKAIENYEDAQLDVRQSIKETFQDLHFPLNGLPKKP